ncbi:expressed unknown protein [Seminavis robusta]|uniref:Hint domain-containing protein n=1 Tax=Seminavis robusta TaxID=568900 RepID=A0A9N8DFX5_9STRA|nr:expressed unknown protein [Seminavis robusta]|eukprot:Sro131_g062350.1 n/a (325) ;mRNA; f:82910-84491
MILMAPKKKKTMMLLASSFVLLHVVPWLLVCPVLVVAGDATEEHQQQFLRAVMKPEQLIEHERQRELTLSYCETGCDNDQDCQAVSICWKDSGKVPLCCKERGVNSKDVCAPASCDNKPYDPDCDPSKDDSCDNIGVNTCFSGQAKPVPARMVQVGHVLQDVMISNDDNNNNNKRMVVTNIRTVTRNGLYAPLTKDGTLVVAGGILASSYTTLQHPQQQQQQSNNNNKGYVYLSGIGSLEFLQLHQSDVAHLWMRPLRLFCNFAETATTTICHNNNNDVEDGLLPWVDIELGGQLLEFETTKRIPFGQTAARRTAPSIFAVHGK